MTKSSIDRKRSQYGEEYTLRFHKKTKTYELTCIDEIPHLIAKFVETDGDLAMRLFELLESNYKKIKELESDVRYFEKTYEIEERGLDCVPEMCTITSNTPSRKELFKYNKELEQRNKRQYNQLNKLWKLIETKDWKTLTEMDNQMKKDEEQLQSEWRFINED